MMVGEARARSIGHPLALFVPLLLQALYMSRTIVAVVDHSPPHRACPDVCRCDPTGLVDCSHSDLTAIPRNIPRSARSLWLQHNKLTTIEKADDLFELPNLTELKLNHNQIKSVQRKSLPPSLQRLHLNNNRLKILHKKAFRQLHKLKWLTLANNNISLIKQRAFPSSLEILELENNLLKELSSEMFLSIHHLEELYLTSNKIRKIDANVFPPRLEHLKLDRNRLKRIELEFSHLTNLRTLYLYSNEIESLHDHAFSHTTALQELNMLNNELTSIQPRVFENLTQLATLNLFSNKIRTFHATALPMSKKKKKKKKKKTLKRLYLQHNPLHCDCQLVWLSTLITEHHLNSEEFDYFFYDDDIPEDQREFGYPDEDIMCASPPELSGKRIEDNINAQLCEFMRLLPTTSPTPATKEYLKPVEVMASSTVTEKKQTVSQENFPFVIHNPVTQPQPVKRPNSQQNSADMLSFVPAQLILTAILAKVLILC